MDMITLILIYAFDLMDRFNEWFNEKFGWFFTNGNKK